jgi:hypothetical protein
MVDEESVVEAVAGLGLDQPRSPALGGVALLQRVDVDPDPTIR